MSNPGLTDFMRKAFMRTSEEYLLGIYHGDTSSHPYVTGGSAIDLVENVKNPIIVKAAAPVAAPAPVVSHAPSHPVTMQPSYGAQVTARYAARREAAIRADAAKPNMP